MTLKERINLLFYKEECIKVIYVDETKRVHTRIIRIGTNKSFEIDSRRFVIDSKLSNFEGSLPTFVYHISNSNAIDFEESKADKYTSKEFDAVFETKIVTDLVNPVLEDGQITTKKLVIIFGILNLLGLGIVGYLIYNGFNNLAENFEEYREIIELIKQILLSNGGLD